MKIQITTILDTDDLTQLAKSDKKELILDLDGSVAEVDFTLDICREMIQSLIRNGESNREKIAKHLFESHA